MNFSGTGPIRGTLSVTNYRLYFRPIQTDNPIILGEQIKFIFLIIYAIPLFLPEIVNKKTGTELSEWERSLNYLPLVQIPSPGFNTS